MGFLTAASQARRRSIDTIADLAFAHVLQRVAKFLMSYAPATTGMAPGLPGVENFSQAQIAAAAGTVRDMAARALLRLKNAAAVELDRGRVQADRSRASAVVRARGAGAAGLSGARPRSVLRFEHARDETGGDHRDENDARPNPRRRR